MSLGPKIALPNQLEALNIASVLVGPAMLDEKKDNCARPCWAPEATPPGLRFPVFGACPTRPGLRFAVLGPCRPALQHFQTYVFQCLAPVRHLGAYVFPCLALVRQRFQAYGVCPPVWRTSMPSASRVTSLFSGVHALRYIAK